MHADSPHPLSPPLFFNYIFRLRTCADARRYVVRQKLTYSLGDPEDDKLVLATIRKIIMDEQAKGFSGLFEVKHVVKQIRERYPKVEEKVPFAMFPKNVTINNEQIDYWDEFTRLLRANAGGEVAGCGCGHGC